MRSRLSKLALFGTSLLTLARADKDLYVDGALASGWENWSWSTDINFAATDLFEGTSSLSATSQAWAALSLKLEGTFGSYVGLKFDIAADATQLQLYFQSTTDNSQSATIPLTAFSKTINKTGFTNVVVDFSALPPSGSPLGPGTWDRVNFQALGDGAAVSAIPAAA